MPKQNNKFLVSSHDYNHLGLVYPHEFAGNFLLPVKKNWPARVAY